MRFSSALACSWLLAGHTGLIAATRLGGSPTESAESSSLELGECLQKIPLTDLDWTLSPSASKRATKLSSLRAQRFCNDAEWFTAVAMCIRDNSVQDTTSEEIYDILANACEGSRVISKAAFLDVTSTRDADIPESFLNEQHPLYRRQSGGSGSVVPGVVGAVCGCIGLLLVALAARVWEHRTLHKMDVVEHKLQDMPIRTNYTNYVDADGNPVPVPGHNYANDQLPQYNAAALPDYSADSTAEATVQPQSETLDTQTRANEDSTQANNEPQHESSANPQFPERAELRTDPKSATKTATEETFAA